MKFLFIFLILYFGLILLKYIILITSLFINHKKALNLFNKINKLFSQRYQTMKLVPEIAQNPDFIQVEHLSDDITNIDRKLALNYILETFILTQNIQVNQQYYDITEQIYKIGSKYNKVALNLKHNTEIYPASFVARLLNIKPVDFLKTVR